ncbi:MAG: hypothetical protein N4A50_02665 [Vallitalea sp.]|jgi:hypothetical protein|nr:hypothetical protein [Vallitalea sp.]
MNESTNYAKPITNTSQVIYDNYIRLISNNLSKLRNNKIVIFGAGVRGTLLSLILQEFGLNKIVFTDNNKQLYGGRVNQFLILPLDDIIEQKEDIIILVSPENSQDIIQQLLNFGFIEHKNLINFGTKLYDWFMEQFTDDQRKDMFIVGDCGLMYFSLFDKIRDSLGTMLKKRFSEYKVKLLSMNAMGMRAFYNILSVQLKMFTKPKYVVMSIDLSMFNGKQHFLPNTQHVDLLERILYYSNEKNFQLKEYLQIAKKRYNNFDNKIITTKAYNSDKLSEAINRSYIKMNYMYNHNIKNEELVYFIKTLNMLREEQIDVFPIVLPINYYQGKAYFGEKFIKSYCENSNFIKNIVNDKGYNLLDLSFLLEAEYFLDTTTIDEAACYDGRLMACDEIIRFFYNNQ